MAAGLLVSRGDQEPGLKTLGRDKATIYALSSGRLPSGVAVVRMSGPRALAAVEAFAGRAPIPRRATLAALRDPADGTLIDRALVLSFPAPASFTGEDVVELHVHGGVAVVQALLRALGAMEGLRLAEPGEFSRRAFDNGKLDLSQAEGLADLIDAQTEAQRKLALDQAGGRLRDRAEAWRSAILRLLAEAEADLDFGDEDDVAVSHDRQAVAELRSDIAHVLADDRVGERIRDGLSIAVVGEPNVGKSSLINALARRDAAIVSDIPGTTRDIIELPMDLGGVPVTLVDTAGLRETQDPVEAEGIRRARIRAEHADLVLHVVETPPHQALGQLVFNKIDRSDRTAGDHEGALYVSAKNGTGMRELEDWLTRWATATVRRDEPPLIARARQRQALEHSVIYLHEAEDEPDPVLRAEALRLAARTMGQVTGRVGVEDVLGEIFGRFCIGK